MTDHRCRTTLTKLRGLTSSEWLLKAYLGPVVHPCKNNQWCCSWLWSLVPTWSLVVNKRLAQGLNATVSRHSIRSFMENNNDRIACVRKADIHLWDTQRSYVAVVRLVFGCRENDSSASQSSEASSHFARHLWFQWTCELQPEYCQRRHPPCCSDRARWASVDRTESPAVTTSHFSEGCSLISRKSPDFCVGFTSIFLVFTARCTLVQSAALRSDIVRPSVCLSVCLSVTFRYREHIGWISSKIISRPNS